MRPTGRGGYEEEARLEAQPEPAEYEEAQAELEVGVAEKKLPRGNGIIGSSYLDPVAHQVTDAVRSLLENHPAVLASAMMADLGLPAIASSAAAVLMRQWIKRHVPTTQIEEISTLASAVIGDKDKAVKWLSEPNPAMDNRPPIDLVGEKDGYERVKNLLLRIEYGVLA